MSSPFSRQRRTAQQSPARLDKPARPRPVLHDLALAILPTAVVLGVFAFVQAFTRERLLFASLASSAFLIYLDPTHRANTVRTLLLSQLTASGLGFGLAALLHPGFAAGGICMVAVIFFMVVADAVHPPAVSTALAFAFRSPHDTNLVVFELALGMIAALVLLQRASQWLIARFERGRGEPAHPR